MNYCLLSVFHLIFLVSHTSRANHSTSDDVFSGSGEIPLHPDPEPTSTTQRLLVPFSTDVDALPSSVSLYVVPSSRLSLSASLPDNILPTSVFGVQVVSTTMSLPSTTTVFLSPSSLSLATYIIRLAEAVTVNQTQINSVISNITRSLAKSLSLQTRDIYDVSLVVASEARRKRQAPQENKELVLFSAIEFSVSVVHVSLVEILQEKVYQRHFDQSLIEASCVLSVCRSGWVVSLSNCLQQKLYH